MEQGLLRQGQGMERETSLIKSLSGQLWQAEFSGKRSGSTSLTTFDGTGGSR